ncbi:MAG: hypothetical protein ABL895_05395 [Cyclobacteriaceae bacterium]
MSRYNIIYYLLFFLLILGAFASMAQNEYGIKILGLVSASFSLLFSIQFLRLYQKNSKHDQYEGLEVISLAVLAAILTMRVFYIRIQFVEIAFGAAGFVLIVIYVIKLMQSWKDISPRNKVLASLVAMFYGSIVLYLISMITVPFLPQLAEPSGGVAFALLIAFAVVSMMRKDILLDEEKMSGIRYVKKFKDRSVVLVALFLLFTAYMGLTKVGAIPKIYSDQYPQAYFELVEQAETGKEKPVDGKFKHEEFKEMYDRFVSRNKTSE